MSALSPASIPFLIVLALLIVHEMDAVHCREWTIFPFLFRLDDGTGFLLFTAAHIPLIFLVLAGLASGSIFQTAIRTVLDVFCIAHVGLHVLFKRHPSNRFENNFSQLIIIACGLAGLVDLVFLIEL